MTEPAHSQSIASVEVAIPAAPPEAILCTQELRNRPRRPSDYERKNLALLRDIERLSDVRIRTTLGAIKT
jgi:hypothetical protein